MRRLVFLLVIVALGTTPGPARAEMTRQESVGYVGTWDPLSPTNCIEYVTQPIGDALGRTYGGACFALEVGETSVSVEVIDDFTGPIGFYFQFVGEDGGCYQRTFDGTCVSDSEGCGTLGPIDVPEGASGVSIVTGAYLLGPLTCSDAGQVPGGGVYGTITATFFDDAVPPPPEEPPA